MKKEDLGDIYDLIKELNYKQNLYRDNNLNFDYIKRRYIETLANSMEYFCGIYINDELIGFLKGRLEVKDDLESLLMALYIKENYTKDKQGNNILKNFEDYLHSVYNVKVFNVIVNDKCECDKFWEENGYNFNRKLNYQDEVYNSYIYTKRRGG
ncbi:GNAT family N-acetyltransferase [Caloramator sp. mosi_1]|uniref:GNAT family N-acetyltransferase n=1 Tax=Caloramator sp. mosi_1 TaxID=3023090 RepID=UPI0023624925|nr:GNAT family N-acetyltransferase [Caloramator sp. mosi_1]WDC85833.1 GNAT family N-acetyltransferase [Caloramator sp. mosi_1]